MSEDNKLFCKKCGAELKSTTKFCGNCGFKVESRINEIDDKTKIKKNNFKILGVGVGIVAVIVLTVASYNVATYFINKSKPQLIKGITYKAIQPEAQVIPQGYPPSTTLYEYNHPVPETGFNPNNYKEATEKITPEFFKGDYVGKNYNIYLYNVYNQIREKMLKVVFYDNNSSTGITKGQPSQQLDSNIANWVKSYCTQSWFETANIRSGYKYFGNDFTYLNFADVQPVATYGEIYDQSDANFYFVPFTDLFKGTPNNNWEQVGDDMTFGIFPSKQAYLDSSYHQWLADGEVGWN